MVVLALLALAMVLADYQFHWLHGLRSYMTGSATPLYWVASAPLRVIEWTQDKLLRDESLAEENERLRQEAFILKGRMLQMSALVAENGRLRELLNSSADLKSDDVIIAEIIGVSPEPDRHIVLVDKGAREDIFVGQPVIDADGLMGQVIEVSARSARILLIADSSHAVPVQVNRNGVRLVAEGTGRIDLLELQHVAPTTDVKIGDLLVTSGLGGRFPAGYPVAKVISIIDDPGTPFLKVTAEPTARLSQSRHVLLVFSRKQPGTAEVAP